MHTKDKLAAALIAADLQEMARKAAEGYYDDFLSPLALPEMQLIGDLGEVATPAAKALRSRVIDGDFDASIEESDAWAESTDGQDTMRSLLGSGGKIRGH